MNITEIPSPNFNLRDPCAPLRYVLLHYTGMATKQDALDRLCDPAFSVSAHYVIDEDGAIFRLVAEEKRAWHAGVGFWQGVRDMNSASIGIELVNGGHEFGTTPFPAPQIGALKELLRDIFARYALRPCAVIGHSDFAPERKSDPGELFPWAELAAEGFGLWPLPEDGDGDGDVGGEACSLALDALLADLGYDPDLLASESGRAAVLCAFARHFLPAGLLASQELDSEVLPALEHKARAVWRAKNLQDRQ